MSVTTILGSARDYQEHESLRPEVQKHFSGDDWQRIYEGGLMCARILPECLLHHSMHTSVRLRVHMKTLQPFKA
jgi:hypothetical protein